MDSPQIEVRYFEEKLREGIADIIARQKSAAAWREGRTARASGKPGSPGERLSELIAAAPFSVSASATGVTASISYPIEMRFADMKHLANWRIYNKIVWGRLFRDVFQEMRYGFREWLEEQNRKGLLDAINQLSK